MILEVMGLYYWNSELTSVQSHNPVDAGCCEQMQDVVNILYFPSSKTTSPTNTGKGIKTRKFEVRRPFGNLPIVQHVSKSISGGTAL